MSTLRQERLEFAPPPAPGLWRSLLLALLAHGLLVAVLTAGIAWRRQPVTTTVSAEIWSALPQQAAPPAPTEPPPPPEPTPAPVPAPAPPPPPKVVPEPTRPSEADIALERQREKARKLEQEKRERAEAEARKRKEEERARLEKEKAQKAEQAKAEKEKAERAKAQAAREQAAREAKEASQARAMEELRQQNLKRMQGLAGAGGSGGPQSSGTAAQDSGPSAGYAGRIVARIKPNIVFTETVVGNPRVEVEIRTAPTGQILSARVTQSSGLKSWDDAVLRAIEKTEVLPRDVDGRIPTSMQIGFRPKD